MTTYIQRRQNHWGGTTPNTYQNDEMEIHSHAIVGAGIVGAGSTVLKYIVAIEKIVEANPVKVPMPDDMPVVKPGWGRCKVQRHLPDRCSIFIRKSFI